MNAFTSKGIYAVKKMILYTVEYIPKFRGFETHSTNKVCNVMPHLLIMYTSGHGLNDQMPIPR